MCVLKYILYSQIFVIQFLVFKFCIFEQFILFQNFVSVRKFVSNFCMSIFWVQFFVFPCSIMLFGIFNFSYLVNMFCLSHLQQRVAVAMQRGNTAAVIETCMRTDNDNVYDFSYH